MKKTPVLTDQPIPVSESVASRSNFRLPECHAIREEAIIGISEASLCGIDKAKTRFGSRASRPFMEGKN